MRGRYKGGAAIVTVRVLKQMRLEQKRKECLETNLLQTRAPVLFARIMRGARMASVYVQRHVRHHRRTSVCAVLMAICECLFIFQLY